MLSRRGASDSQRSQKNNGGWKRAFLYVVLHGSMNDDKNLWWYFQQVLHCCDWQMTRSGTSHIWGPPASNTRSGCQRVEQKVSVATLQSHCLVVMSGACGPGAISTYLWIQDQKETSLCPRVSQTKTDMPRQSYCNRNAAKAPSQPGQQKVISRQRHVWGIPIAQVSQMPFWLQSSTKHERKKSDLAGFLWAKRATQRGAAWLRRSTHVAWRVGCCI